MKKASPRIEGTKIICKGNIEKAFEIMPTDLFHYIELGLISHTDLVIYMKLNQFYNKDLGYAYPTNSQLMFYTNTGSKATIQKSLNNLVAVGLIEKGKVKHRNSVYKTFKPWTQPELYKLFPDQVQSRQEREEKLLEKAANDQVRWEEYKLNSPE